MECQDDAELICSKVENIKLTAPTDVIFTVRAKAISDSDADSDWKLSNQFKTNSDKKLPIELDIKTNCKQLIDKQILVECADKVNVFTVKDTLKQTPLSFERCGYDGSQPTKKCTVVESDNTQTNQPCIDL